MSPVNPSSLTGSIDESDTDVKQIAMNQLEFSEFDHEVAALGPRWRNVNLDGLETADFEM